MKVQFNGGFMKNDIDKECICCKRLYSGSCDGIENRGRTEINSYNRCSGHLYIDNESDCNCDDNLYYKIKGIEKEIGIN